MFPKLDCSTSYTLENFSVNNLDQNPLSLKENRVRRGFNIFKHKHLEKQIINST